MLELLKNKSFNQENLLKEKLKNVGTLFISGLPTYVNTCFNQKHFGHEVKTCGLKNPCCSCEGAHLVLAPCLRVGIGRTSTKG